MQNSKTRLLIKRCAVCFFAALIGASLASNAFAQVSSDNPSIKKIIPERIFPDMFVRIEGEGLYKSDARTYFIFSQGDDVVQKTYADGGGERNGVWGAKVRVPRGLRAGICKIEVEIENKRGAPFFIDVTPSPEPPQLEYVSDPIVNPGYLVLIGGSGFSADQTLEMTDAEGQKFTKTIDGVSSANSLHFEIPPTAYSGIAKFRVIENRGGSRRASNELSLEIRRGAIPLRFYEKHFVPLARGQWFALHPDPRPLYEATKIEFRLTQGKKSATSFVTNFRRLHFEVPKSFRAGKMTVQTRTWIGDEVSEWSPPYEFVIAGKRARPGFHSLENVPPRAEAMFRQAGETIAVTPVDFGALPHAVYPKNSRRGDLEIYTRYWEGDGFTDWRRIATYLDFDYETTTYVYHRGYEKEKAYGFSPFYERHFLENNPSKIFVGKKNTNLVIFGNFYVESVTRLTLLFENGAQRISLKPSEHEVSDALVVAVPKEMPTGDWRLWVINEDHKIKAKVPVKIRFN